MNSGRAKGNVEKFWGEITSNMGKDIDEATIAFMEVDLLGYCLAVGPIGSILF